mgnify:CR=1 FL=1
MSETPEVGRVTSAEAAARTRAWRRWAVDCDGRDCIWCAAWLHGWDTAAAPSMPIPEGIRDADWIEFARQGRKSGRAWWRRNGGVAALAALRDAGGAT